MVRGLGVTQMIVQAHLGADRPKPHPMPEMHTLVGASNVGRMEMSCAWMLAGSFVCRSTPVAVGVSICVCVCVRVF